MRAFLVVLTYALMLSAPGQAGDRPVGPFDFTATAVTVVSRGVRVPAVLTVPKVTGKYPLVVMAHGHGGSKDENGGFTAIAEALAARGVASVRMDFPGCGASVEPFTQNNITNMMADVAAARAYAIAHAPIDVHAVGIFGYSMGGRIAILSAASGYNVLGLLAPKGNDGNDDPSFAPGGPLAYAEAATKARAEGHVVITTEFGQGPRRKVLHRQRSHAHPLSRRHLSRTHPDCDRRRGYRDPVRNHQTRCECGEEECGHRNREDRGR